MGSNIFFDVVISSKVEGMIMEVLTFSYKPNYPIFYWELGSKEHHPYVLR